MSGDGASCPRLGCRKSAITVSRPGKVDIAAPRELHVRRLSGETRRSQDIHVSPHGPRSKPKMDVRLRTTQIGPARRPATFIKGSPARRGPTTAVRPSAGQFPHATNHLNLSSCFSIMQPRAHGNGFWSIKLSYSPSLRCSDPCPLTVLARALGCPLLPTTTTSMQYSGICRCQSETARRAAVPLII